MSEEGKPPPITVGRIVHYKTRSEKGEGRTDALAAIVVWVNPDGTPNLEVWSYLGGSFFMESVPFANSPTPGHWSWPPRSA